MLWALAFGLAIVETWLLIEAGKWDRRSNRIGAGHKVIWQSAGLEVLVEIVLLVTGILIYVEDWKLIIPTCVGVVIGTLGNKYYRQHKFRKQQFKPRVKQSEHEDEDEEEGL